MTRRAVVPFRPPGFLPAGAVNWARLLPENVSPFRNLRSRGHTAAQRAGKKYEAKVLRNLLGTYNDLQIHRWFQFDSGELTRFCQPDAYLIEGERLTIFEIKLSSTELAKYQLRDLYAPVLIKVFEPKQVRLVEIVRHCEAPKGARLYLDFAEFVNAPYDPHLYEVLRWRL